MSIYQAVGIGSPVVLQSVFRRVSGGMKEGFLATSAEFHKRLAKEAEAVRTRLLQERSDTILRTAQVTKGALNQFLSTPISSDNEEVQRILRDGFEKLGEQIGPEVAKDFFSSWDARVLTESSLSTVRRGSGLGRLVSTARRELNENGVRSTGGGDVVETCFAAAGLCTPEVVDRIVRVALEGIDVDARVVLALERPGSAALYENVFSSGIVKGAAGLWEAALRPDARKSLPWEAFVPLAEGMMKEFNFDALQIWRERYLAPLRGGLSFRVRIIADPQLLGALLKWLNTWPEKELGAALAKSGSLIVKEILP